MPLLMSNTSMPDIAVFVVTNVYQHVRWLLGQRRRGKNVKGKVMVTMTTTTMMMMVVMISHPAKGTVSSSDTLNKT